MGRVNARAEDSGEPLQGIFLFLEHVNVDLEVAQVRDLCKVELLFRRNLPVVLQSDFKKTTSSVGG